MKLKRNLAQIILGLSIPISMIGCSDQYNRNQTNGDTSKNNFVYEYLVGVVKSENFNYDSNDRYYFTVETDEDIKSCEVWGRVDAPHVDALLNPGDKVKIILKRGQRLDKSSFYINENQITEINGKPYNYTHH